MTEQTEQTEQTETVAAAEYPEQIIRVNFPFEDVKTISGNWTAWSEPTRRQFADLIASTRPSDVPQVVAAFLGENDPAADVESDVETVESPPPAGSDLDDPSDRGADLEDQVDAPTSVTMETESQHANGSAQEHRVHTALKTAATAKAWAEQHPEDIEAMIEHETSDQGKARKSVLAELRDLQPKTAGK